MKSHRTEFKTKPIEIILHLWNTHLYVRSPEELIKTLFEQQGEVGTHLIHKEIEDLFFLGSLTEPILNFRWTTNSLTVNWFLASPRKNSFIHCVWFNRIGQASAVGPAFPMWQLNRDLNFLIIAVALKCLDFQAILLWKFQILVWCLEISI